MQHNGMPKVKIIIIIIIIYTKCTILAEPEFWKQQSRYRG